MLILQGKQRIYRFTQWNQAGNTEFKKPKKTSQDQII